MVERQREQTSRHARALVVRVLVAHVFGCVAHAWVACLASEFLSSTILINDLTVQEFSIKTYNYTCTEVSAILLCLYKKFMCIILYIRYLPYVVQESTRSLQVQRTTSNNYAFICYIEISLSPFDYINYVYQCMPFENSINHASHQYIAAYNISQIL